MVSVCFSHGWQVVTGKRARRPPQRFQNSSFEISDGYIRAGSFGCLVLRAVGCVLWAMGCGLACWHAGTVAVWHTVRMRERKR